MNNIRVGTPTSRKTAFTLIELLVVIAIIAILAAILFPVFAPAREKARQATCLSNEKQIDLAVQMYLQDYDETFFPHVTERQAPVTVPNTAQDRLPYTYKYKLEPYIKNYVRQGISIYKCPSGHPWPAPAPGKWYTYDYGFHLNEANLINPYTQWQWYQNNPDFGFNETTNLASLSYPASFIIFAEADRPDHNGSRGGLYPAPWWLAYGASDGNYARPVVRHQDGLNVGYADGHVKWKHPNDTWRSYNDNDWRRTPLPGQ
jgi:prepilin-type N-terminal cleavage/methylation domain-containing protein/prepilin-type processing-associated H-X9-DG protein